MSGIIPNGRVRAQVAPVGTSPADPDGDWRDLGHLTVDGLTFATGGVVPAPLESWGMAGPFTFTIPLHVVRCSWRGHRFMHGRPHPGQRRAKALYRRRAHRRTGRRR
ncbi:hypothetical protein ACQP2T_61485 [Nonomuraea sp. CA-143628]|uniref:hypothetical protein n=1 Tax=Nonomuraea sp. CA-143628 TaxID=3239997 RepID=UPI003D8A20EE